MLKFFVPTLAAVVAASVFAGPVQAALLRTFVSGAGSDANACDARTVPCRTLSGALGKTAAGGEISVLDSGEFGSVTIQKSITITGDGTAMAISGGGASVFLITGVFDAVVTLRGLDIDGFLSGVGAGGVRFSGAGGELHVQNCTIRNFNGSGGAGILFQPSAPSKLFVSDTNVQYNGTSTTGGGIVVAPVSGGAAIAVLTRVQSEGNSTAFKADSSGATGFVNMTIADSSASGGSQHGVWAVGGGGGVDVAITYSRIISNGGSGLRAEGSTARLFYSYSLIMNNGLGLNPVSPGQVITNGTNQNRGNFSQGAPSSTVAQD